MLKKTNKLLVIILMSLLVLLFLGRPAFFKPTPSKVTSSKKTIDTKAVTLKGQINFKIPKVGPREAPVFGLVLSKDAATELGTQIDFGSLDYIAKSDFFFSGRSLNTSNGDLVKIFISKQTSELLAITNNSLGFVKNKNVTLKNIQAKHVSDLNLVISNLSVLDASDCIPQYRSTTDLITSCKSLNFQSPYHIDYVDNAKDTDATLVSTESDYWKKKNIYKYKFDVLYAIGKLKPGKIREYNSPVRADLSSQSVPQDIITTAFKVVLQAVSFVAEATPTPSETSVIPSVPEASPSQGYRPAGKHLECVENDFGDGEKKTTCEFVDDVAGNDNTDKCSREIGGTSNCGYHYECKNGRCEFTESLVGNVNNTCDYNANYGEIGSCGYLDCVEADCQPKPKDIQEKKENTCDLSAKSGALLSCQYLGCDRDKSTCQYLPKDPQAVATVEPLCIGKKSGDICVAGHLECMKDRKYCQYVKGTGPDTCSGSKEYFYQETRDEKNCPGTDYTGNCVSTTIDDSDSVISGVKKFSAFCRLNAVTAGYNNCNDGDKCLFPQCDNDGVCKMLPGQSGDCDLAENDSGNKDLNPKCPVKFSLKCAFGECQLTKEKRNGEYFRDCSTSDNSTCLAPGCDEDGTCKLMPIENVGADQGKIGLELSTLRQPCDLGDNSKCQKYACKGNKCEVVSSTSGNSYDDIDKCDPNDQYACRYAYTTCENGACITKYSEVEGKKSDCDIKDALACIHYECRGAKCKFFETPGKSNCEDDFSCQYEGCDDLYGCILLAKFDENGNEIPLENRKRACSSSNPCPTSSETPIESQSPPSSDTPVESPTPPKWETPTDSQTPSSSETPTVSVTPSSSEVSTESETPSISQYEAEVSVSPTITSTVSPDWPTIDPSSAQSPQDTSSEYQAANYEKTRNYKAAPNLSKFGEQKIKIEVFQDLKCGMCAYGFKNMITPLLADQELEGKYELVFREYPLISSVSTTEPDKTHPTVVLAEALKCAAKQNKYKDFLAEYYANSKEYKSDNISALSDKIGMNKSNFDSCLNQHETYADVYSDIQLARKLKIDGTPTFVVNGKIYPGASTYKDFKELLSRSF